MIIKDVGYSTQTCDPSRSEDEFLGVVDGDGVKSFLYQTSVEIEVVLDSLWF